MPFLAPATDPAVVSLPVGPLDIFGQLRQCPEQESSFPCTWRPYDQDWWWGEGPLLERARDSSVMPPEATHSEPRNFPVTDN